MANAAIGLSGFIEQVEADKRIYQQLRFRAFLRDITARAKHESIGKGPKVSRRRRSKRREMGV